MVKGRDVVCCGFGMIREMFTKVERKVQKFRDQRYTHVVVTFKLSHQCGTYFKKEKSAKLKMKARNEK